jgi:CRP-like cAMP-binding protein
VRAAEDSQLFAVDEATFDRLLADTVHLPDFAPTLQRVAELRQLPAFSALSSDDLSVVMEHGQWLNAPPGEMVIEVGGTGDAFYAIGSGQVDVIRDGEVVRTLGPGAHFGEVALLMDVPRTATVAAKTPVRVFRLDRHGFDRAVAQAFRHGTLDPTVPLDRTWQH